MQVRSTRLAGVLTAGIIAFEPGGLARLAPESIRAWTTYVAATESRRAAEVARPGRFLVLDMQPTAAAERQALTSGAVVIRHMETTDAGGEDLEVPRGMVHHWRGAVLLRGATIDRVLARLKEGPPPQEDVLRSAVLERGADMMRVYLQLRRTKIVTVVYNTEHRVTFARYDASHAASASEATKIAELSQPGTPSERELAPGDDRGFLWRLNAYWRYEAVPGGVIAECESISLSRSVPFVLRYVAGPIIESTARESMEKTLVALQAAFR